VAAVDPRVSPRLVVVSDDRYPPGSPPRRAVVAAAVAVVAAAVAVADCPSVACAISPRAATLPADSKTRPELVNEKTDEDTGQLLGYG